MEFLAIMPIGAVLAVLMVVGSRPKHRAIPKAVASRSRHFSPGATPPWKEDIALSHPMGELEIWSSAGLSEVTRTILFVAEVYFRSVRDPRGWTFAPHMRPFESFVRRNVFALATAEGIFDLAREYRPWRRGIHRNNPAKEARSVVRRSQSYFPESSNPCYPPYSQDDFSIDGASLASRIRVDASNSNADGSRVGSARTG